VDYGPYRNALNFGSIKLGLVRVSAATARQ